MSIEITCSRCGKLLRVPDHYAGKRGRCKACGEAFVAVSNALPKDAGYDLIKVEAPTAPLKPAVASPATARPPTSTSETSDGRKHSARPDTPGFRWPLATIVAAVTLSIVALGAVVLRPAFLAARKKAIATVERDARHDAETQRAVSPSGPIKVLDTPGSPALGADGLPPLDDDPSTKELEHFIRELILTANRLRRLIEPVKTLAEAQRVAPEVAKLSEVLSSAETREQALPPATREQKERLDSKYKDLAARAMESAMKEIERFEGLAKKPPAAVATTDGPTLGNANSKSILAPGMAAPNVNQVSIVVLCGRPSPTRDFVVEQIQKMGRALGKKVSSVSIEYYPDRIVCLLGASGDPSETARRIDFGDVTRIEGRAIEVKPHEVKLDIAASGPPDVPDHFLFRPRIETAIGMLRGGTVFACKLPGDERPILLTALHIFGPAGGLEKQITATELPKSVKKVTLTGLFDKSEVVSVGADVLSIPDAGPLGTPSRAGDVVAIRAPQGTKLTTRPLANSLPKKGERIWLAASLLEGAPPEQRLHSGKVDGLDEDGLLIYIFDDPKTQVRATSGAPVLNAAGEVVAIQAGSGKDGQSLLGVATPVTKFRRYLDAALKARPAVKPKRGGRMTKPGA